MEPIASAEAIAEACAEAVRRLVPLWPKPASASAASSSPVNRVDNERADHDDQHLARATRDGAHLARLLCAKIEKIEPGFGIERLRLIAARVEPLAPQPVEGAMAGEKPAPDLAALIDRLAVRLGARRIHRLTALESDLPERSVARAGPLAEHRGLARLAPPDPPALAAGAGRQGDVRPARRPPRSASSGAAEPYRVAAADGPERIYGEWWRHDDGARRRPRLFPGRGRTRAPASGCSARATARIPATGDLSWHLHGLFA